MATDLLKEITELVHVPTGSVIFSGGGNIECGVIKGLIYRVLDKYILSKNYDNGRSFNVYKKRGCKLLYTLSFDSDYATDRIKIVALENEDLIIISDEKNKSIKAFKLSSGIKLYERVGVYLTREDLVDGKLQCTLDRNPTTGRYDIALLNTSNLRTYKDTSIVPNSFYNSDLQYGYIFVDYNTLKKEFGNKLYYIDTNRTYSMDTKSINSNKFHLLNGNYFLYGYTSYDYSFNVVCYKKANGIWSYVWASTIPIYYDSDIKYYFHNNSLILYSKSNISDLYKLDVTSGAYNKTSLKMDFGYIKGNEWVTEKDISAKGISAQKSLITIIKDISII